MSPDVKSFEFRIQSRSGEERWISHICQAVYGEDGQYLGRRASNHDITQRKQTEEALRQAHQALESRVEDRTLQLKITAEELKVRQAELLGHKRELERVNRELLETNRAVTVLARNIDKHRRDEENRYAKTISSKIIPLIEDLKKAKTLDNVMLGLDFITANVQDLSNDLAGKMNLLASLTPTELRVASMIKKGLTSRRIADKLCVSLQTIKSHRRNIRKKLNLQNSAINLESYLKSIMW
jgi:DNA-binding CsgD family transcriptional regulator